MGDSPPSDVVNRFLAHEDGASCVAFSNNIATGGCDGTVKLWDLGMQKELSTSKLLRSPPSCISFTENGMLMAVATTGPKDNFNVKILPTGSRSIMVGKTSFEGHLD